MKHSSKMCTDYKQLSISSQSVETCSELVRSDERCKLGRGHFFYGEVNPSHKECACCPSVSDTLDESKMRANSHFNIYQLKQAQQNEDDDGTDGNFKLAHRYRECGKQSRNFGPIKTAEACASVALEDNCESFMFSHKYPVWGCRCCDKAEGGKLHKLWHVYTVDEDFSRSKKQYYKTKAKYDAVKEIIETGKDQIMEDELKQNAVKLDDKDKNSIVDAIKKYRQYRPSKK